MFISLFSRSFISIHTLDHYLIGKVNNYSIIISNIIDNRQK